VIQAWNSGRCERRPFILPKTNQNLKIMFRRLLTCDHDGRISIEGRTPRRRVHKMRLKTMSSNHLTWMVMLLSVISAFGFSPLQGHATTGLIWIRPTDVSSSRMTALSSVPSSDNDDENYYDEEEFPQSSSNAAAAATTRRPGGRIRPIRQSSSTFKEVEARQAEAQLRHLQALQDPTLLTNVQFADRPDIHPATKRAIIEVMGLQCMTEIQAKTYAAALSGDSVLGRARTGTGKTLAFLLPSLERLLETDLSLYRPGRSIGIVIIAPTRELAIQIADQARDLLTYHNDMDVLCMYGGTKMQRDIRLLTSKPQLPTILVSTPGRLLDHLETTTTRIQRRKFSDILSETRIVVLDETDRLFETNSKEVTKILSFLPRPEKRQTLLFSATVPNPLRGILRNTMKINYTEVDCVNNHESNGGGGSSSSTAIMAETNQRVEQSFFLLDNMEHYVSTLVALVLHAMKNDDTHHKILVFLPASKLVRYFSTLFNSGFGIPVLEIHSRMSQSSRIRASNTFRAAKKGVLFTSDVSARGESRRQGFRRWKIRPSTLIFGTSFFLLLHSPRY
jgi:ATP-dependent RNA helicase MSS116, mitochondrial